MTKEDGWDCVTTACITSSCTALTTAPSTSSPIASTSVLASTTTPPPSTSTGTGQSYATTTPLPLQACSMQGNVFQVNPYPCALNKFFVAFSANVSLAQGVTITINGLCSVTPDDSAIDINEMDLTIGTFEQSLDSWSSLSDGSSQRLSTSGVWNQSACTLEVDLSRRINNDETVAFWVELRNPTDANTGESCSDDRLLRNAASVSVTCSSICVAEYLLENDYRQIDLTCPLNLPLEGRDAYQDVEDAQLGDAQIGVVYRSRWLQRDIGQSTPYPSCLNTIHVTLAFSSPIVPDCPVPFKIQLSNFADFSRTATATNSEVRLLPMAPQSPLSGSLTLNPHHCLVKLIFLSL